MQHRDGHFRGGGGTELYWQSWHPDGMPRAALVAVHGLSDHSGGLRNVVNHLAPAGVACYGFDLRGHGRSPGPRGHVGAWDEFRADLAAFLDRVAAEERGRPVYLAGHSMGGLLALDHAIAAPKGLAGAIAMAPALSTSIPAALMLLVRAIAVFHPRFTVTNAPNYAELTRDPAMVEVLQADTLRQNFMTASLGRAVAQAQRRVMAGAGGLQVPLLMLHCSGDPVTPSADQRRFYEGVRGAAKERHEFESPVHRPFDDTNRTEVLSRLSEWLERQLAGSSGAEAVRP